MNYMRTTLSTSTYIQKNLFQFGRKKNKRWIWISRKPKATANWRNHIEKCVKFILQSGGTHTSCNIHGVIQCHPLDCLRDLFTPETSKTICVTQFLQYKPFYKRSLGSTNEKNRTKTNKTRPVQTNKTSGPN